MTHLDAAAFLYVHGLSGHIALLDAASIFFAEYMAYVWASALVLAVLWPSNQKARNRIIIAVSVSAALIARLMVKTAIVLVYSRARPFIVSTDIHPLISTSALENLQSFPSGHAISFFALATVLFCFNKKIGAIALVAAAVMGAARVYAGVHWPSDIIGGAALGILTGFVTYSYYIRRERYFNEKIGKVLTFLKAFAIN